jgi:hypothetical protein
MPGFHPVNLSTGASSVTGISWFSTVWSRTSMVTVSRSTVILMC